MIPTFSPKGKGGKQEKLKLLFFVCFTAPVSSKPPVGTPPHLPSTPAAVATSDKGKRPSLVLIIGIGAGILLIAIISVLIICLCTSHQGRKTEPFKEAGM